MTARFRPAGDAADHGTGRRFGHEHTPAPAGAAPAASAAAPEPGPAAVAAPVRWIALIAAVAVGVELAVSARYGYHRDELYFLAAGQHPAFGYVDQPPLTPLLARLTAVVSGNSLVALRLLPALVMAALIGLTAAMSRLLGPAAPARSSPPWPPRPAPSSSGPRT